MQVLFFGHIALSEENKRPAHGPHRYFPGYPRIDYEKLTDERPTEQSGAVRIRVQAARQVQIERFGSTGITCNSDMGAAEIKQHCKIDAAAQELMKTAMKQIHFTARAFHRTLKLARTIADLDNASAISTAHLAEALQYRQRNINQ